MTVLICLESHFDGLFVFLGCGIFVCKWSLISFVLVFLREICSAVVLMTNTSHKIYFSSFVIVMTGILTLKMVGSRAAVGSFFGLSTNLHRPHISGH